MKHKAQLRKLARGLRKLPPEKFNMCYWIETDAKRITCNTAGCAIGWLPRLVPECGLKLKRVVSSRLIYGDESTFFYQPEFRDNDDCLLEGWEAISKYFDIDEADVYYLFDADHYDYLTGKKISPSVVADRIEDYLKHGRPETQDNECEDDGDELGL